jgi:hypothetical protein
VSKRRSPSLAAGAFSSSDVPQISRHNDSSGNIPNAGGGPNIPSVGGPNIPNAYAANIAEKCLQLAQTFNDLEAKRELLVMANAWLTLALQREKNIETAEAVVSVHPPSAEKS